MKILGIIGSPRENGNTAAMVNAVCKGAASAGHTTEVLHITSLAIHDCVACGGCKTGKIQYCAIKDDMQKIYPKIVEADCLVIGSPIYMGQITGHLKNFFDRWYPFVDANYEIHQLPGKKYITAIASGAPAEVFHSVTDYLNHWLGSFFKMKLVKNIVAGGLGPADAIQGQPEILAAAEAAGRELK